MAVHAALTRVVLVLLPNQLSDLILTLNCKPSLGERVFLYMVNLLTIDRKIKKATQIAFKLKESNQTGRAFHLTAVFKKNRLLTVGVNNYKKTHPEVEKIKYLNKENERYNACIHSELAAWLNLDKANCSDFVFVNVRIDKNNKVGMSRPCSGCIKLLKKIRFKKFYYTDCDGNFIEYK